MKGRRSIVRIDSDGMPKDTVVSLEDGTELDKVYSVWWSIDTDSTARVEVSVWGSVIHVAGELQKVELKCPCCAEVIAHECKLRD